MRWIAATLLCAGLSCSAHARASDLALTWSAPASCPALPELEASLRTRLARTLSFGPDSATRLAGHVVATDGGYRLALTTHTESSSEQRTLEAKSCNELARAAVLVASLLLSTRPIAAPEPEREQMSGAGSGAARLHLHLTLAGALDVGRLPALAPGVAAHLGLGLARWRLSAAGLYLFEQRQRVASQPGASVALQLTAAQLAVCYALLRLPEVASCAYAELGSLRAQGRGLPQNERATSLWLLGGLGLTLAVPLTRQLQLAAELTAGAPLLRAELSVRELGRVYRVSALAGQLQVGLRVLLP